MAKTKKKPEGRSPKERAQDDLVMSVSALLPLHLVGDSPFLSAAFSPLYVPLTVIYLIDS